MTMWARWAALLRRWRGAGTPAAAAPAAYRGPARSEAERGPGRGAHRAANDNADDFMPAAFDLGQALNGLQADRFTFDTSSAAPPPAHAEPPITRQ